MRHPSAPGVTQPGTSAVRPTTATAGSREATIGDLPVAERRYDLVLQPHLSWLSSARLHR